MTVMLLLALATWRLAHMLAEEDGPFNVFGELRFRLPGELGTGAVCMWCNSVWIGALWALAWYVAADLVLYLALPWALSAASIGLQEGSAWLERVSRRS